MAVLTRPPGWFLQKTAPPGYRFSPTEIELILFYLKNKLLGQNLAMIDRVMPEVDLYKSPPWDISEILLKSRVQQDYFLCRHEKKFASSSRKRRSTNTGQWRTTGKDKKITHKSETVGMKKTLVFYARGHLPGERTNWVIHEYSLCEQLLGDSDVMKNGYVLCKLFEKSCSSPSNHNPWAVEDCEDDSYGDDIAFIPNSSFTGGWEADKPCCSKDIMEESVSCVPDDTNFDFPGITSQEVTSYSESSSPHKTNGCQHSSFSLEGDYDIDDDIHIAAHTSFHGGIPVIHLPSECDENSYDLESTLLNYQTNDFDSCSSQQENTSPTKRLCYCPPEPTPEFESHGSFKDTLNISPIYELCTIDTQCYSSLDFDECQQKNEVAFFHPGFRFSPTETQLLLFYLRNKVLGRKLTIVDKVMPEVDLYKISPWDISEKYFKGRDQQEYFFCRHERKFASSLRKKRSTSTGQWKTTGIDKKIYCNSQTVGMKRTLVFYIQGSERTNWVIYEYSLYDQQLGDSGGLKNDYVLCKFFKKSVSDPNNYKPSSAEDCEDAYSDDVELIPNSCVTGGLRPDIPCCLKDIMEERVSCIPDKTDFTFDFSGATSQEVTSHLESSYPHKTNGWQHGSCSLEETYVFHADIGITANVSSFYHGIPTIHLSSERNEDSFDLERTLLNYPTDITGCSYQLENTVQTKQVELTPEFESHESSGNIFNILPSDELCPIDPQCYCSLDID